MKFSVCIGSSCHVKGSYNVLMTFRQLVEEYHLNGKVKVAQEFCTGQCTDAVAVRVDDEGPFSVSGAGAKEFFLEKTKALREE
ncbi:(2Fe-2S) ferredoxin domain-containing protein [Acidaminobacterium chupaoyuni]